METEWYNRALKKDIVFRKKDIVGGRREILTIGGKVPCKDDHPRRVIYPHK
jgi:hypothetical protein